MGGVHVPAVVDDQQNVDRGLDRRRHTGIRLATGLEWQRIARAPDRASDRARAKRQRGIDRSARVHDIRLSPIRRVLSKVVLAAVVSSPAEVNAHGESKSVSEWTVAADAGGVRIAFAAHDLLAALPAIDIDGNRVLAPDELKKAEDAIATEVLRGTQIIADGASCKLDRFDVGGLGTPIEEVRVAAALVCPNRIRELRLEQRYLGALEPPHVAIAIVTSRDKTAHYTFTPTAPPFRFVVPEPPQGEVVALAFARGARAATSIALVVFLAALVVTPRTAHAGLLTAAFVATETITILFFPARPSSWAQLFVALAAGWLIFEALSRRHSLVRRLLLAGICAAVIGLDASASLARTAPVLERAAFALGAVAPAIAVGIVVRVALAFARR
jgi:hypothetical protein